MENESKYKKTFSSALSVAEDKINDSLEYNGIPEWDIHWSYDFNFSTGGRI